MITPQVVHLWNTSLTEEQLEQLFSAILAGSCLKRVNVGRNDLSPVAADLLARAANMLEAAEMELTGLSCLQVNSCFNTLIQSISRSVF